MTGNATGKLVCLALATAFLVNPAAAEATKDKQEIYRLAAGRHRGVEWRLEVRQMPLAKALDNIAKQTGVPIHFSGLPDNLVTATCAGSALKMVLECLLNKKTDLIVRYSHAADRPNNNGPIAEVWVIGSRPGSASSSSNKDSASMARNAGTDIAKHRQARVKPEKLKHRLIQKSQSADAMQRADAISALLSLQKRGDPDIKAILEQALNDQDARVRAQAISTYAHLEGSEASDAIQQAMQDSSTDVRLMAVDGITDDMALLQEAVNDSDETIRSLARIKLDKLIERKHGRAVNDRKKVIK